MLQPIPFHTFGWLLSYSRGVVTPYPSVMSYAVSGLKRKMFHLWNNNVENYKYKIEWIINCIRYGRLKYGLAIKYLRDTSLHKLYLILLITLNNSYLFITILLL